MSLPSLRPVASWCLVLALLGILVAACGGAQDPTSTASPDDVAAGDGAALFTANCAVCHGAQGEGSGLGPPLVHETYEPGHHSDQSFRQAMAEGVVPHHWDFGPMPPQPQVGEAEAEAEAIIAHVRDLQRDAGIID
jgi:mono/diheme cytochrome c family protein